MSIISLIIELKDTDGKKERIWAFIGYITDPFFGLTSLMYLGILLIIYATLEL